MDTPVAPSPSLPAKSPKSRPHTSATLRQAIDVQCVNHKALLAIAKDFDRCATTAERMIVADSLAKLTASWRVATAERREIHNRPRAGQLSPAERAEMRRRKSSRSKQAAPKVSAKESLSEPAPSPRVAPAEGAAGQA